MADRTAQDYIRSAQRRLDNAALLYRQTRASEQRYDDAFLELADVGMLVWSAGIDVLSALMAFEGRTNLGDSSQRHDYLRGYLHRLYPQKELRVGWRHLSWLHNFQHNLDLAEPRFVEACRQSGRLFDELNGLLPSVLRMPEEAYAWLLAVQ